MTIVTLLTDFGTADSYVAEMKGVLLTYAPTATLVDISHEVSPGDVRAAQYILSRAWMLDGIVSGLPARDRRLPALLAAARAHGQAGLAAVTGEHYEGGHWLGTFAVYLSTARGLRTPAGKTVP